MTISPTYGGHRSTIRIPRTRGAVSGLVLIVLGVWGSLLPFLGPTFGYAYTPADSWHWTLWRLFLEVLPGVAAIVGGLLLLFSVDRISASVGGWLAVAGGLWFVVGLPLATVAGIDNVGVPAGGNPTLRAWEQVGLFYGVGAVIVLFGALALGRLAVVGVRDMAIADRHARRRSEADAAVVDREPVVRPSAPQQDEPRGRDVAAADPEDGPGVVEDEPHHGRLSGRHRIHH